MATFLWVVISICCWWESSANSRWLSFPSKSLIGTALPCCVCLNRVCVAKLGLSKLQSADACAFRELRNAVARRLTKVASVDNPGCWRYTDWMATTDFGTDLLRRRRLAAYSQTSLARACGLSRSTIKNLEEGRTSPSRDSLERLERVLPAEDAEIDTQRAHNHPHPACFSSHYDPVGMSRAMERSLNGPGGVLEQTSAYLDTQSATDWLDYANAVSYSSKFRDVFPLTQLADAILSHWHGAFDLIALGVGDGKSETAIVSTLLSSAHADLRYYLLDISHPLLVVAYNHATTELGDNATVFPIHGNFLALSSVVALAYRPSARPRLWTMIGFTFGNLDHEPRFLFDLSACAKPGDLLLLDVSIGWAAHTDEAAVREADPALNQPVPPLCERWLLGPVRRHCRAATAVRLEVAFSRVCPVPGSYQLTFLAHTELAGGGKARHQLFLLRRYNLAELSATLAELGWRTVSQYTYGVARPQKAGVLLLERM